MAQKHNNSFYGLDEAALDISDVLFYLSLNIPNIRDDRVSRAISTALLISLHDALKYLKGESAHIDFIDNVEEGTVTDLVRHARDAACHTDSGKRRIGKSGGRVSFSIGHPGSNVTIVSPNRTDRLGCPFPDDHSLHFGEYRLFFKRQIERAAIEAKGRIISLGAEQGRSLEHLFMVF